MSFFSITVKTNYREEFLNITERVKRELAGSGIKEGLCVVYIPHTTAGVTINEAADPAVLHDINMELGKIVPLNDGYTHLEGNSAAHLKTLITGSSVSIPVEKGHLSLGRWQGIFFCEYDGPRQRTVYIKIIETK